ncbi:MAG TPA: hypothetical protein VJ837_00720 [Candidatus Paceibacterota bacterium]|nr:hypothetical protein [Candidatus Paceibacterota bacterium]
MRNVFPNEATTAREATEAGFVKIILLIVVGLVVLGYFGINIADVLASPVVRDNLAYAWDVTLRVWDSYLQVPAEWLWDNVLRLIWELFTNGLEDLRNGDGPSSLIPDAPSYGE